MWRLQVTILVSFWSQAISRKSKCQIYDWSYCVFQKIQYFVAGVLNRELYFAPVDCYTCSSWYICASGISIFVCECVCGVAWCGGGGGCVCVCACVCVRACVCILQVCHVFDQTYDYFTKNKLLYTSQYCFRKQHSTELAAVELVDRVAHYLDPGKLPVSIFLDLQKAFDTLNHTILFKKKKTSNGTSLDWFRSYLSNRSQYVDYDGTTSISLALTTGVPQGSILGPLLFIIYMNEIHEASQNFEVILCANDTNLTSPITYSSPPFSTKEGDIEVTSSNINSELNDIQEWLRINNFSLNV